jgi:multidrug efflux pump
MKLFGMLLLLIFSIRPAFSLARLNPHSALQRVINKLEGTPLSPQEAARSGLQKSSSVHGLEATLLTVIFIFLVLSVQVERFVYPPTILFAVPLVASGTPAPLFLFEESLNICPQIGLIILIGLLTKTSSLIVEFSNQFRLPGESISDTVIQASTILLRPILMPSFFRIFGVLPIAIGFGAGAESRRPLGLAVVGGMLFSTFLTLVLVPVLYTVLARFTTETKESEVSPAQESPDAASVRAVAG